MEQENEKRILVLKIIAFELGTTNSPIPEDDIILGNQCVTKHP